MSYTTKSQPIFQVEIEKETFKLKYVNTLKNNKENHAKLEYVCCLNCTWSIYLNGNQIRRNKQKISNTTKK